MNYELQRAASRLAVENLALARALMREVKPEPSSVRTLLSQVRKLTLLLLNAQETDEAVKEATASFQRRLQEQGLPWFLANYQTEAMAHLTPARRLSFCRLLLEECEAQQVGPLPLWQQIVVDQGLTIEEQENQ